ncbi:MAG: NAD(P)-binding domain-containing protein, partial [Myxococcaceae bacterium]|nr:NAD(P)-binding domain-containing protein [Myxococcaceae bacterium]
EALASRLVSLGHDVRIGSRTANNEKASAWVQRMKVHASQGTFADAAAFGEVLINCTAGSKSVEALKSIPEEHLAAKLLMDVANPLVFSSGMLPTLSVVNDDSLGERIQRTFPSLKVVKTLNTMNCHVMVDPSKVPGEHTVFLSGNDASAKAQAREILAAFGWEDIVDLGDITTARGTEMYLLLWLRLSGTLKTSTFNIRVVR